MSFQAHAFCLYFLKCISYHFEIHVYPLVARLLHCWTEWLFFFPNDFLRSHSTVKILLLYELRELVRLKQSKKIQIDSKHNISGRKIHDFISPPKYWWIKLLEAFNRKTCHAANCQLLLLNERGNKACILIVFVRIMIKNPFFFSGKKKRKRKISS